MITLSVVDEQFIKNRNSCILNNTDKGAVLKALTLIDHKVYKIQYSIWFVGTRNMNYVT